MKVVFYSVVLNHHQAPVADEFYRILSEDYTFVETMQSKDLKGSVEDFSKRPYLLRSWESVDSCNKAMELALTADVCVFSGVSSLPFMKERMSLGLLSFDMSERWLKQGLPNLFSPAILKMFLAYYLGGWKKKPLYKLCCSAFAANDHSILGMYSGKCYRWGYFTKIEKFEVETDRGVSTSSRAPLMWCSRYLKLKHPELPVLLAGRLKEKGYDFHLNMYGEGEYKLQTQALVERLGLQNEVTFIGAMPNDRLMMDMRKHDIFLFTSDRNEGWGAVANESMANGCVLVASDGIGSSPYLVNEGETGMMFRSPSISSSFNAPDVGSLDSLCEKVEYLIDNREKLRQMKSNAIMQMRQLWSPENAAVSFLKLVDDLSCGRQSSIDKGPCSIADVI